MRIYICNKIEDTNYIQIYNAQDNKNIVINMEEKSLKIFDYATDDVEIMIENIMYLKIDNEVIFNQKEKFKCNTEK